MKITNTEVLININKTDELIRNQIKQVEDGLRAVVNPPNAKTFSLYNGAKSDSSKSKKHQNGVKPIKTDCISYLKKHGWKTEVKLDLGATQKRPGPIDAVSPLAIPKNKTSRVALEWETGNISSSHRSLNRMTIGILNQELLGGILVLPSRATYDYLTDRVGNFQELSPYFDIWRKANYHLNQGYLAVIKFEYDALSSDPNLRIHKGTDGRASK